MKCVDKTRLLKSSVLEKAKEKANPPAAKNKNAATPFKKGEIFLPTRGASCFISPFLKGVAVPLVYTAGGFAFGLFFLVPMLCVGMHMLLENVRKQYAFPRRAWERGVLTK